MYVVFDMGATKTRIATSIDGVNLSEAIIFGTGQGYETGIAQLIENIETAAAGQSINLIVGGVAGTLDRHHWQLYRSPNLPAWVSQPLQQALAEHFDCTVLLENDSALVGLGEATCGAGRHKSIVGYITDSTGVGGVRVVDGRIDRNALGFEPGYQIIGSDNKGPIRLEQAVGGHALEQKYASRPEDIKDAAIWMEVSRYLAIGLHNTILHWSPEVIILGGGMVRHISLIELTAQVRDLLICYPEIPEIVAAELGDKAGLAGALVYAKSKND